MAVMAGPGPTLAHEVPTRVLMDDSFVEHGGVEQVFIDYEAESLIVRALRCVNTSNVVIGVQLTGVASGVSYDLTCPPGTSRALNLPTDESARLQYFINPNNGRLDGIDHHYGNVDFGEPSTGWFPGSGLGSLPGAAETPELGSIALFATGLTGLASYSLLRLRGRRPH